MSRELRVASYNIHRCVGTDSVYRPGRIVEVIRELDADVLGLQEVDAFVMHKEGHQLDLIAKETGYELVVGATMYWENAEYGNAILTRLPILSSRNHDITVHPFEPRGALEAEIDAWGRPVRVLNTHLGLRFLERRHQVHRLLRIVSQRKELPLVLLGDFNEWIPRVGCTKTLAHHFATHGHLRTYPSPRPLFSLDRIYVNQPDRLLAAEVISNPLARRASDHLPVRARVSL